MVVRLWHKAVTAGYPATRLAWPGDGLDAGRSATYSAAHADLTELRDLLFTDRPDAVRQRAVPESFQLIGQEPPAPLAHRLDRDATCSATEPTERGNSSGSISAQSSTIRARNARTCGAECPRTLPVRTCR